VGRNLNQIARVANLGLPTNGPTRETFEPFSALWKACAEARRRVGRYWMNQLRIRDPSVRRAHAVTHDREGMDFVQDAEQDP